MTTQIPSPTRAFDDAVPAGGSVRALISELAQVEDAVRRARTFTPTDTTDANGPVLNPQLLELIEREAQIIAALRARRFTRP